MKTIDVIRIIFEILTKIVRWFGKFFEDQRGNPSSKRAIAYITLYMLSDKIETSMHLKVEITPYVLGTYVLIELVALGVIGSEFFVNNGIPGFTSKTKKEATSEETIVETTETTEDK